MKRICNIPFLSAVFLSTALVCGSQAHASTTLNAGDISFLDQCPGDSFVTEDGKEFIGPALIPALLTPLITGAVDFALKSTGERLIEAAQEQQADLLHRGSYFFVVREGEEPTSGTLVPYLDQKPWCLIIVSRATVDTDTTVSDLVEEYARYQFQIDTKTRKRTYIKQDSDEEARNKLVAELQELGFVGRSTPGLLAIFDFEVSDQGTTFRLVPRFVVMDHSIREKKVDDRSRDISFEFNFGIPLEEPKTLKPMIKIEGLKIGIPFQGNPINPSLTSHWIARPKPDGDDPTEAKVEDNFLVAGQRSRTFDLTIEIKEFRKRPIAEFFGGLLTSDATRKQFVDAIVPVLDPATRQSIQATEDAEQTALKISLSNFIDAAEKARRDYAEATPGTLDQETKFDLWRSAQRSANLEAQKAGIAIPYPEAGFFRTSP